MDKCVVLLFHPATLDHYPHDDIILASFKARCQSNPNKQLYYIVFVSRMLTEERIIDAIIDENYKPYRDRENADIYFETRNIEPDEIVFDYYPLPP